MIIFSNGNGVQTANLEFLNGAIYNAAGYVSVSVGEIGSDNLGIAVRDHVLYVTTSSEGMISVVRADGMRQLVELHMGVNAIELPRGFYIVGGRKVIL